MSSVSFYFLMRPLENVKSYMWLTFMLRTVVPLDSGGTESQKTMFNKFSEVTNVIIPGKDRIFNKWYWTTVYIYDFLKKEKTQSQSYTIVKI